MGSRLTGLCLRCGCIILIHIPLSSGTVAARSQEPTPAVSAARASGVDSPMFPPAGRFALATAWKKSLGSGYSAVSVGGGYAVTMFSDGDSDLTIAFDASTGAERWRYTIGESYDGIDGSYDGPIGTPLIHEGRVFCLSPQGRFFGLDLGNGRPLWSKDLVAEFGSPSPFYGFGATPIVSAGTLILGVGGKNDAYAGFNPADGALLWSGIKDSVEYQLPIEDPWVGAGRVIVGSAKRLYCLDSRTGSILWDYEHGGGAHEGSGSLEPIPAGNGRLFLKHSGRASCLVAVKANGQSAELELV